MKKTLIFVGASLAFMLSGHAQDFPRIAPKAVPPVAPAQPPSGNSTPTVVQDSDVLLPKLQGLVLVSQPNEVVKRGVRAKGINFTDVTVPDAPAFLKLVSPAIGVKLTHGDLDALITKIILYYRHHDRPVIGVLLPEQDIATGTVQLLILEGRVGTITTTGNRWFSSEEFRTAVSLRPGDEIRASQLRDDLAFINQNPFHTTTVVYHPGEKAGETNLELQTQDRFPARFYVDYEDNGDKATGFDRYEAGFNWGDAFHLGLGQQLNYQYTTSGDGESLRAHAGGYVIPLPWHTTLNFFGSYTDTQGVIPPLIGIRGRSYQISGRYTVPLPTYVNEGLKLNFKENVAAGFDYKFNKNALEFGTLPAGGTLYDVEQFVFSYNGVMTDPYGQTTVDDEFYYSPGGLGGHNNDAAYNGAHTGATSDYVYDTLSLERLTRIPGNWSLVLRGTLQLSDANLAPSEQLGFGGFDSVRGYDDREVNADEGFVFTTEVRTPPISIAKFIGQSKVHDQLQLLAFWDYGSAYNHDLLPGEAYETPLSSVGAGLRYNINTYVSVRYDYGFQLLSTGLDNRHGSRSDLGIMVSY